MMQEERESIGFSRSNSKDLSLYFRQIQLKTSKAISCIQIYQNWLYVGTRQFLAYAIEIHDNFESSALELDNQASFPAQCKSAAFIVASQQFLIIIPSQEQQIIRIWNRLTLQVLHGYCGHEKQISAVIFLKDQSHFVSSSHDGTIRVWNILNPNEDLPLRKYTGVYPLLTLAELDEQTLAFGGDDCVITVWNWLHDRVVNKFFAHAGSVTSLSLCSRHLLYSTGGDSLVKGWKITSLGDKHCLTKIKQFKKALTQNVFTIHTAEGEVLSIDSRGRAELMNHHLQITSSHLKIEYDESICNIKLWRNRLFVLINSNGKGRLKEIAVDLQDLRNKLACKELKPPQNSKILLNQMDSLSINISWRNLNLVDPTTKTSILTDLAGCVESGNFISIMGPSGAGKSSLLSILTCRLRKDNSNLQIQGELFMNGETYHLSDFSKIAAYVQQDDVLFGTLTVRETFAFQAKLKLWSSTPQAQQEKCNEMLQKLNLIDCADTLVGNGQFKKSISGGQKKRVAIGVELLSNPKILVFDEPTSGLDSHNALNITRLLSKLAKQENKLVIATIHQPSTLIFRQMDQLYLLKGGRRIYSGKSSNIVPYMESIGIKVDYRMNPADFFMFEMSALKQQTGYQTPLNSQNFQKYSTKLQLQQCTELRHSKTVILQKYNQVEQAPFSKQFWPLLERGFKNFYRTPSNQFNKLIIGVLIPIFFGILFESIGSEVPADFSQAYLLDYFSFLFMGHFIIFSMNIYETGLVFPAEKEIVCKEAGSNLYSLIIYFLAKLGTEILGCIIPAITSGVIIFFAADLDPSFGHFAVFIGIFILLAVAGFLFGLMYGVLNKNAEKAITIMPLAVIPMLVFGGLIIKINDIPAYIRWMQYLTPLRHSFMILFQDQLSSSSLAPYSNMNLPNIYGLDGDPYEALGWLIGLSGLYLGLTLLLLMALKKKI